ncbi:hypothetical protein TNCV_1749181 [Trichonephila clavipes]|nr:hypothetical protein TNCV_1749181 [Trichonephila clavipes]
MDKIKSYYVVNQICYERTIDKVVLNNDLIHLTAGQVGRISALLTQHYEEGVGNLDILETLKRLSTSSGSCQHGWERNCGQLSQGETTTPAAPLTYLELFSKYKAKNKAIWMIPPAAPWFEAAEDEIQLRSLVSLVVIRCH